MAEADFNSLMKQARNERTRLLLREIQRDWKLVREKGQFIKGRRLLNLDLGIYEIWMRQCSAPSSIDIYTEIFRRKAHSILPQFSGKRDRVIFDIGANEGFYTLRIKQNNPSAKIVAVEANPSAFEILKKNVTTNKLEDVILINKALTSTIGKVTFEIVPEVSAIGALDMRVQKRPWLRKEIIRKVNIEGVTLERICKDTGIEEIDLLKLDVEGAELEILRSSIDLLENIKKIVVEYHTPELRQEVKEFLRRNKFILLREDEGAGCCGDLYFIRK